MQTQDVNRELKDKPLKKQGDELAGIAQQASRELSKGVPSRPVLGLPLRRVIPMDVHSVMDYAGSLACVAAAAVCDSPVCKAVNYGSAAAGSCVSACTDYRLSLVKLIPIEAHEVIDYLWGGLNCAAPFLFGYWKKEKLASFLQIYTGASTLLASLFTDYRSYSRAAT